MINVRIQHQEVKKLSPKITVVGVGGAGGNAVNNMISSGLEGCEFLVCNTDAQALEGSLCENRIQMGITVTGGLGAGAKPEIGRAAAEESLDEVLQYLEGSNMAFITAGMGGGSGTGGAPIIAQHCREKGILTVGVVTKPFHFEGSLRMKMAEEGIEEMQEYVDTLIVIPNQNLFRVANEKTTFAEAFKMADGVLQSAVRGVTDLMVRPGLINLDFADIRSVMLEMGKAMMGTGEATGEKRAIESAEAAINNPLLDDVSMKGARGVIINVTGGDDMTLFEVDEACNRIRDEVDPNANIIIGSTFDSSLEGTMRVSVVATGIDAAELKSVNRTSGSAGFKPAVTQTKIERAQPKTETAVPVSQPMGIAPAVQKAPMATPAPQQVSMETMADEPETDMFEQNEFAPTPARTATPASMQTMPGQSMRGTVYRDSFIPPKPMTPQDTAQAERMTTPAPTATMPASAQTQTGAPGMSGLMASRPSYAAADTESASGLTLRPPVPGGSAQQKKQQRTPSLFERFTTPLRQYTEGLTGDHHRDSGETDSTQQGQGGNAGRPPMGLHAPRTQGGAAPSQGNLAIDSPSVTRAEVQKEDELDIPAFLRRQAN
ncbi:MAG: cell division protein FtsZ [Rhodospirillales bacterium]|nr:cell division protein FtsZ [Rhodospirillales bacterium]